MPRIGAHVRGSIKGSVTHALDIQAEAFQIFVGSPQTWRAANPAASDVAAFREQVSEAALGPVFVHAIYLINLASGATEIYEKSVTSLITQINLADRIGAAGLIFHPGSAGTASYEEALERVVRALEMALSEAQGATRVVLEVCAGQGQTLGVNFQQIADIIQALGQDPRLAVCWDTCHLFNAGYDIADRDGLERTLSEMDTMVGLDRLVAVHANDSKNPLGACVDRHENIGRGYIGEEGFARMLAHPALDHLPFILEVPGFDGNGPDLENVRIMRRLGGRPLGADVA